METYTVRVDLAYEPWDDANVEEFGHGEPAALVALLDLVRLEGIKLHVFMSLPFMRLFPSAVTAVLGDLHDLDLLLTPGVTWEDAQSLAAEHHYRFEGIALPRDVNLQNPPKANIKFISDNTSLESDSPQYPVNLVSHVHPDQLQSDKPNLVYLIPLSQRWTTDPDFVQTLADLQTLKSSKRRNRSLRDLVNQPI